MRGRKVEAPEAAQPRGGLGACFLRKFLNLEVSEMPFPAFSAGHFQ